MDDNAFNLKALFLSLRLYTMVECCRGEDMCNFTATMLLSKMRARIGADIVDEFRSLIVRQSADIYHRPDRYEHIKAVKNEVDNHGDAEDKQPGGAAEGSGGAATSSRSKITPLIDTDDDEEEQAEEHMAAQQATEAMAAEMAEHSDDDDDLFAGPCPRKAPRYVR